MLGFHRTYTVIDLYSRKVVGYAVADHMRTNLCHEVSGGPVTARIGGWGDAGGGGEVGGVAGAGAVVADERQAHLGTQADQPGVAPVAGGPAVAAQSAGWRSSCPPQRVQHCSASRSAPARQPPLISTARARHPTARRGRRAGRWCRSRCGTPVTSTRRTGGGVSTVRAAPAAGGW